jgi:hypothetical protein
LHTVNEFETRLRTLSFREPPPGLRAMILAGAQPHDWRNWLAPHPGAWAALAAFWIALGVANAVLDAPGKFAQRESVATASPPETPALLAFYRSAGVADPSR